MVRFLQSRHADVSCNPMVPTDSQETLHRACAYLQAIGACFLLVILGITIL